MAVRRRILAIAVLGVPALLAGAGSLVVAQEQPPAIQPSGRQPPAIPPNDSEPPVPPSSLRKPIVVATRPTAAEVRAQMPRLFADLANADPAIRENARVGLMGASRIDLGAFEKIVRENLPLVPAQAAVLKEIVTHAYLAGEEYPAVEREGFLGVRLLEVNVVSRPEQNDGQAGDDPNPFDPRRPLTSGPPTTGVLIVERMPGFCGARSLLDGDVVLGIVERPGEPVRNPSEMREKVTGFKAGETIHFQLLRQGQVINVPVTLDPRPEAADPLNAGLNAMQNLIDDRKMRAAEFWDKAFAPMLKEAAG